MLTISALLVLAAFVVTVLAANGRGHLWIAVLLLVLVHLFALLPL